MNKQIFKAKSSKEPGTDSYIPDGKEVYLHANGIMIMADNEPLGSIVIDPDKEYEITIEEVG